ncbi:MAG: hypothetical protein RR920_00845 [Lachnospiraceae bacterium]
MGKKKKDKTAQDPNQEQEKRESRKPSKKIIIIILLIIIIVSVVGGAVFMIMKKKAAEEAARKKAEITPPKYYFSKEDEIAAITEIVGKRSCKNTKKNHQYQKVKDTVSDIETYGTYLKDKKQFVDATSLIESSKDTKEQGKDKSTGSSYQFVGETSKDKGKKTVWIKIDSKDSGYTVTLSTKDQTLADVKNELDGKEEDDVLAWGDAISKITSKSAEELGLSLTPAEYDYVPFEGRTVINDEDYFEIRTYLPNEIGTRDFVALFFVKCKKGDIIYKIDETTGQPVLVGNAPTTPPEASATTEVDATAESIKKDSTTDTTTKKDSKDSKDSKKKSNDKKKTKDKKK